MLHVYVAVNERGLVIAATQAATRLQHARTDLGAADICWRHGRRCCTGCCSQCCQPSRHQTVRHTNTILRIIEGTESGKAHSVPCMPLRRLARKQRLNPVQEKYLSGSRTLENGPKGVTTCQCGCVNIHSLAKLHLFRIICTRPCRFQSLCRTTIIQCIPGLPSGHPQIDLNTVRARAPPVDIHVTPVGNLTLYVRVHHLWTFM